MDYSNCFKTLAWPNQKAKPVYWSPSWLNVSQLEDSAVNIFVAYPSSRRPRFGGNDAFVIESHQIKIGLKSIGFDGSDIASSCWSVKLMALVWDS